MQHTNNKAMHIGKRIENLFDKTDNLTKKSFAKSIGVTEGYIYKIFEKSNINTDLLWKISKALNVSPAYFFEENGKPEDYQAKDKPGVYDKEGAIKAILQIELTHDKKDQVLKFIFGNSNLEILNK